MPRTIWVAVTATAAIILALGLYLAMPVTGSADDQAMRLPTDPVQLRTTLEERDNWLVGERFSAADSYALIFFRWGRRIGLDMAGYPKWAALNQRLLVEASVQRVVEKEELGTELFQPA